MSFKVEERSVDCCVQVQTNHRKLSLWTLALHTASSFIQVVKGGKIRFIFIVSLIAFFSLQLSEERRVYMLFFPLFHVCFCWEITNLMWFTECGKSCGVRVSCSYSQSQFILLLPLLGLTPFLIYLIITWNPWKDKAVQTSFLQFCVYMCYVWVCFRVRLHKTNWFLQSSFPHLPGWVTVQEVHTVFKF